MSTEKQKVNGWQQLQTLSSEFAEGLVTNSALAATKNRYGRNIQVSSKGDAAFNIGLATTGLRTVSFIDRSTIHNLPNWLSQAIDQQLPMLFVALYDGLEEILSLEQHGPVILSASTWQEALDLMCIGHFLAEKSLIPVVVAIPSTMMKHEGHMKLEKALFKGYLGNPDSWIDSPTPAQKLIFGEKRKQIPNWYDPDLPVTIGSAKQKKDVAYQEAAHRLFFESHLPEMMDEAFSRFAEMTERKYNPVLSREDKKADMALVFTGLDPEMVEEATTQFRALKNRLSVHQLVVLHPVFNFSGSFRKMTVLENATRPTLKNRINTGSPVETYSALFSEIEDSKVIIKSLDHMKQGGEKEYWINIQISKDKSKFPKHDVLLQHIKRDYKDLTSKQILSENREAAPNVANRMVSAKVRKLRDEGPAYAKVTRFYDDTALLYNTDEMIVDPFQALSVMPSDTASFKDNRREHLPVFKPGNYNGATDPFVFCPHSALLPMAVSVSDMIKGAMATSKKNGRVLKTFTPLVKTIATMANKELKTKGDSIETVKDFLPGIAEKVFKAKRLDGDKLTQAKEELKTLVSLIGDIPVAVTDLFFTQQNAADPAAGELFTLGLDTSACIGCGICANACHEGEIEMVDQDQENLEQANRTFEQFENIPGTSDEVIERLISDKDYDSIAALFFNRKFMQSINSASSEHEPAQKVMLHIMGSMTEMAIEPKVGKTISAIDDLLMKLEAVVRKNLSDALPTSDFDGLNESLRSAHGQKIPFNEMIANWGNQEHLKLIDTSDLQLRMDLIHDLKDLKWALEEGPTGQGRARYGLLIDSDLKEFVEYPWSTFTTPALVNWNASNAAMTEGLVQGCIRHTIDNIKIMRRAQLVAQKKYNPAVHDEELAGLTWADLTAAEQAVVMPIVMVMRRENLENNQSLMRLLDQPWPLKLMILDNGVLEGPGATSDISWTQTQLLPLIIQQKAVVFKGSMGQKEELFNGLKTALEASQPALCWLFAPRANSHNTPWQKWPILNSMALNTRAFTHLFYDPSAKANMLSSAIDMNGNPMPKSDWNVLDLVYTEEGEEKNIEYAFTWADWAFTQHAWRGEFVEVPAEDETMSVAELLALDPRKRKGKKAAIYRIGADQNLQKFLPSDKVIEMTEASLKTWRALQEIAGLKTAFPEKLRQEVEAEFTKLKDVEIKKLEKAHQDKIAALEGEYLEQMKEKIKAKLMDLSKMMDES